MSKLLLFVGALALLQVACASVINSITYDAFEILELDYPNFITDFKYDWVSDRFYVFGGNTFRQINHRSSFQAIDNTSLTAYDAPFLDVRLFTTQDGKFWAVGPALNDPTRPDSAKGYFNPLVVLGEGIDLRFQGDYQGYTFYSVSVDMRNESHVIAYFAGWGPGTAGAVEFVLVRTFFSLVDFQGITWDPLKDTVFLHENSYAPFSATYKPYIIHDYNLNEIFVVSPSFLTIYRVKADNAGLLPLQLLDALEIKGYGPMKGATFHWYADLFYLGFSSQNGYNSNLIEVDLKNWKISRKLEFPTNYSNPRCISGRNTTLYVGFEGGPGLLAVETKGNDLVVSGYANTPGSLHNVYAAWDEGSDHVYFATHEQFGKVFRTKKSNFCKSSCPQHGYCDNQQCKCGFPYVMSKDKKTCVLNLEEKKVISDKGAAVAFGILWGLTCVVAAIGWAIVYRARQQGYQRVL